MFIKFFSLSSAPLEKIYTTNSASVVATTAISSQNSTNGATAQLQDVSESRENASVPASTHPRRKTTPRLANPAASSFGIRQQHLSSSVGKETLLLSNRFQLVTAYRRSYRPPKPTEFLSRSDQSPASSSKSRRNKPESRSGVI